MAWNQSTKNSESQTTKNSESQNKESEIAKKPECKRPKCVSFAFWWFIVLGILVPACKLDHLLSSMYPWTDFASAFLIGILMLDCARMISKRNITAVFLSVLTLFFSGWILGGEMIPAAIICIMPMIFLVLPHSIRWLRLNNRFSVSVLMASLFMVSVSCWLCFVPSVTHSVISNVNPLSVVVPGDKAPHLIVGASLGQDCWQHGRWIGVLYPWYNQNGECCCVRLDARGESSWEDVIDMCNQRFDNRILWSNAIAAKRRETGEVLLRLCGIEGLPMLCGIVDEKIITISPGRYGRLLVCDSKLNSELDFLFAMPEENVLISQLNDFLENRDWFLSAERDVDDAKRNKRHDLCAGLEELRNQAVMLEHLSLAIEPAMDEIEDRRVAKIVETFELRRKAMWELSRIISSIAHMAVTAIEYNTRAIAMCRDERIKLRREYLEKDSPVPEELLPMDPMDHSGQNRIFDKFAKQFKEGRAELYWELHRKTGYNLGRPYNPELESRGRGQSSIAPDQGTNKENGFSEQSTTKPIHNDPIHSFYGSKDRQKLFSSEVRNGVGMY